MSVMTTPRGETIDLFELKKKLDDALIDARYAASIQNAYARAASDVVEFSRFLSDGEIIAAYKAVTGAKPCK